MLTFTLLLLGQCVGVNCPVPAAALFYSYQPTSPVYAPTYLYSVPPAYTPTYPAPAVRPAVTYVRPNPPAIVAAEAPKYTRRDGDGNSWTHADPEYLRAWVAGRDAALDRAAARVTMVRTTASRVPQAPVPPQAPPLEP